MIDEAIRKRGYGFIKRKTIKHLAGPDIMLPIRDLILHINENELVPRHAGKGTWITFYIRDNPERRHGIEVVCAELE